MIYLFHGEDTLRSLNKINELIKSALDKKGEIAKFSVFEMNEENFSEDYFKTLLSSAHLFGNKNLVVFKMVLNNEQATNLIFQNIEKLESSENIFIFWEGEIEKEALEKFQSRAKKITEFKKLNELHMKKWAFEKAAECGIDIKNKESQTAVLNLLSIYGNNLNTLKKELEKLALGFYEENAVKKEQINIFLLTDAFATKNKKSAWLVFQKMLLNGTSEEEIFWKIFWQVKNISALKPHENEPPDLTAEKFSLHPFVIKKTLSASKLFTKEELENLSKKLIKIFENERFNKIELNLGIEELILNL